MSEKPERVPEGLRNAIVAGVVLGVVAAGVVWFLERFEVARLHAEIRSHLESHDAFQAFLRERGES